MSIKTKEEIFKEIYSSPVIKDMFNSLNDESKKKEIMQTAEKALSQLYDEFMSFNQSAKNIEPANLEEEIDKKTILKDK